jgi:hypothetical protein
VIRLVVEFDGDEEPPEDHHFWSREFANSHWATPPALESYVDVGGNCLPVDRIDYRLGGTMIITVRGQNSNTAQNLRSVGFRPDPDHWGSDDD